MIFLSISYHIYVTCLATVTQHKSHASQVHYHYYCVSIFLWWNIKNRNTVVFFPTPPWLIARSSNTISHKVPIIAVVQVASQVFRSILCQWCLCGWYSIKDFPCTTYLINQSISTKHFSKHGTIEPCNMFFHNDLVPSVELGRPPILNDPFSHVVAHPCSLPSI